MRPPANTGDAEWLPPSRSCQWISPVSASTQVAMPKSETMYSSSPTRIGDGVSGAPRRSCHATCDRVTSPAPSARTASSVGCWKPVDRYTSPWP